MDEEIYTFGEKAYMIHVAIVEDNEKTREKLQQYLLRYEKESKNSYSIQLYEDGIDIVNDYTSTYDVILMDIQMKKMDGIEAAKEIRKIDKEVFLIFITNMVQYAINGYAVNAADYLLKPLSYFTFSECMRRIEIHLAKKKKNYLTWNVAGGIIKIDMTDIYYMESQGHYIYIHKTDGIVSVLETMKNMENLLIPNGFFRCSSGYLVNLYYVEKIVKYTVWVGGDELSISRTRKKEFMEALTDYLGGTIK